MYLVCLLFFQVLFSDFRYQSYMHRKSSAELFPLDHEIERTLFRRKKAKAANAKMEDHNSDRFSENHLDHNEIPGLRKLTLGDCWDSMMNEDYSRILHQ